MMELGEAKAVAKFLICNYIIFDILYSRVELDILFELEMSTVPAPL